MHSRVAGMGWIEVICGCMFSGIAREMVRDPGPRPMFQVFKNALDTRCPANEVGSHDGKTTPAVSVANVADLWRLVAPNTDVVAIDEAQFFGPDLVLVCQRLADAGHARFAGDCEGSDEASSRLRSLRWSGDAFPAIA